MSLAELLSAQAEGSFTPAPRSKQSVYSYPNAATLELAYAEVTAAQQQAFVEARQRLEQDG